MQLCRISPSGHMDLALLYEMSKSTRFSDVILYPFIKNRSSSVGVIHKEHALRLGPEFVGSSQRASSQPASQPVCQSVRRRWASETRLQVVGPAVRRQPEVRSGRYELQKIEMLFVTNVGLKGLFSSWQTFSCWSSFVTKRSRKSDLFCDKTWVSKTHFLLHANLLINAVYLCDKSHLEECYICVRGKWFVCITRAIQLSQCFLFVIKKELWKLSCEIIELINNCFPLMISIRRLCPLCDELRVNDKRLEKENRN
jgi:hypothetical protein